MGIGQALVHHCNPIAAYVGDLPSYILLLDIIFALDIQAIHAGEIDKRLLIIPIFVFVFVPIFFQARALRALGPLLADGAPTVGRGKTF